MAGAVWKPPSLRFFPAEVQGGASGGCGCKVKSQGSWVRKDEMKSLPTGKISAPPLRVVCALVVFILCANSASKSQSTPTLTPEELRVYQKAHTVIDWKPREIHGTKELKGLQPVESQQDLPKILQEVGERVTAFMDKFPNTTATEFIRWKLDSPSSPASYAEQFRYWTERSSAGSEKTIREYRTDTQGKDIDYIGDSGASLLTSGFTLYVELLRSAQSARLPLPLFWPANAGRAGYECGGLRANPGNGRAPGKSQ